MIKPLVDTHDPDFRMLTSPSRFSNKFGKKRDKNENRHNGNSRPSKLGLIVGTTNPLCLNSMADHCPALYVINVPKSNIYIPNRVEQAER